MSEQMEVGQLARLGDSEAYRAGRAMLKHFPNTKANVRKHLTGILLHIDATRNDEGYSEYTDARYRELKGVIMYLVVMWGLRAWRDGNTITFYNPITQAQSSFDLDELEE